MSELTTGMRAGLAQREACLFGAVQISLPGYELKLIDGAMAFANEPWKAFVARDATYGVIESIDKISDGTGDEAPAISMTLLPPENTAAAALCSADMQGARVRCWLGVVDKATGIVVPDPVMLFDGVLDVATLNVGSRTRSVDYDVVSVFEKFFNLEEAIRLSDSWHQSVWPGELGLANVTGVSQTIPWGTNNLGSVVKK